MVLICRTYLEDSRNSANNYPNSTSIYSTVAAKSTKARSAQRMVRLRTHGDEKTQLNAVLLVCNVENIPVTSEETFYLYLCRNWNVVNERIASKYYGNFTEKRETNPNVL